MEQKMNDIQDLRIARQFTHSQQDTAIRGKLQDLLSTELSKSVIGDLRHNLENFFGFAFQNLNNPQAIRENYDTLLPQLSDSAHAKIAEGEKNIEALRSENGVIIVTNHFGLGALTIIDNSSGTYPVDLDEFPGFPVRLAGLRLVSEKLEKPVYEAAIELPEPLLTIQKATPTLIVPITGTGRTEKLIQDTKDAMQGSGAVIVMYPEGGTSGKRNNGGPYDLDEFHSGAFVVASQLGLPILPVCQVLNPNSGLELHVLSPKNVGSADANEIKEVMNQTKAEMQSKLQEVTQSK